MNGKSSRMSNPKKDNRGVHVSIHGGESLIQHKKALIYEL